MLGDSQSNQFRSRVHPPSEGYHRKCTIRAMMTFENCAAWDLDDDELKDKIRDKITHKVAGKHCHDHFMFGNHQRLGQQDHLLEQQEAAKYK